MRRLAPLLLALPLAWMLAGDRFFVPDSAGYLAWLRSAVHDGDFHFKDEFLQWGMPRRWFYPTDQGFIGNEYAIGSAFLWAPFWLLGHLGPASLVQEGYGPLPLFCLHLGVLFYAGLALVVAARWAAPRIGPAPARLAAGLVAFGTPLAYYALAAPFYAHVPSALAVGLVLLAADRFREHGAPRDALLFGLAAGLAALVRWQDALFALIAAPALLRAPRSLAAAAGGFALAFAPQAIGWWRLYGSPLTLPQAGERMEWAAPPVHRLLFSSFHGLVPWTPLAAVALLGLAALRDRRLALGLAVLAAAQVWLASVFNWWGGYSLGARRLVNLTPILVLGLGALVARVPRALAIAAGGACALWTTLLAVGLNTGRTPGQEHEPLATLAARSLGFLQHPFAAAREIGETRPFHGGVPFGAGLLAVLGTAGIAWLLSRARRPGLALAAAAAATVAAGLVALGAGPPLEPEERAALGRFLELRARAAPEEAGQLGALAFDLGRYRDALAAYRRGGSFETRLGAGLCLLKLEDPDARGWFDALAAERPDDPRLAFYRGLAEAAAFRFDAAARRFEEVLAREPDHRGALVEIARCRERLGQHAEAEAALERLARLDPRGAARLEELRRRRARAW